MQPHGKFLCVIWFPVIKTYPKFVTLHSFLKVFKIIFKNEKKKLEKIHMDFEKSTNVFEIKQGSHLISKTWNRSWNFHELVEISFVHQKKINKLLTLNRSENMYIFSFASANYFLIVKKKDEILAWKTFKSHGILWDWYCQGEVRQYSKFPKKIQKIFELISYTIFKVLEKFY